MNKRLLLGSVAGLLAIGLTATPAFAQRGGGGGRGCGGGGGGRSFGGGYGGGGYGGGGYGNYGRGYGGYGNNWNGGYGNNWNGGYGRGYSGVGIGLGFGSPYYGGTYSNGYYGTPNSYAYGTYANQQPIVGIDSGLSNYQAQLNGLPVDPTGNSVASMQSFYSGPSSSAGSAKVTVKVPADAQLWLGPMESGQQGTEREFSFPSLPAGDNMFTLRATWNENGQAVKRERQVNVKSGANATVDLTKASNDNQTPSNSNIGHPSDTNTSGQKIMPNTNKNGLKTTPNTNGSGQRITPPARPDTDINQ
ncbi:hypothetical protein BH10PLA2_BH10PLA2_33510 [soil metagenome]